MIKLMRIVVGWLIPLLAISGCRHHTNDHSKETPPLASPAPLKVSARLEAIEDYQILSASKSGVPRIITGTLGMLPPDVLTAPRLDVRRLDDIVSLFDEESRNTQLKEIRKDSNANRHIFLKRLRNQIVVVGGTLVVHVNASNVVYGINGNSWEEPANLAVSPKINIERAKEIVKSLYQHPRIGAGRLVYMFPTDTGVLHLAFEILAEDTQSRPIRMDRVYIDAVSGVVLERRSLIHRAENRRVISAFNTYVTTNQVAQRSEGDSANIDPVINNAYNNAGIAYQCFKDLFGRDSYDGSGGSMDAVVHYGAASDNTTFWVDVLHRAIFADDQNANGNTGGAPDDAVIDIVAHEFGHGISEIGSDLMTDGEGGAVNEGLSDIFGLTCKAYSKKFVPDANTWQYAGEFGARESMSNPKLVNPCDQDYYPQLLPSNATCGNPGDTQGNAHFNSTIASLAFFLLSQGGKHPRGLTPAVVPAIGMQAAAKIFYLADTNGWLEQASSIPELAGATAAAAWDQTGQSSTVQDDVRLSWYAVGICPPNPCYKIKCGAYQHPCGLNVFCGSCTPLPKRCATCEQLKASCGDVYNGCRNIHCGECATGLSCSVGHQCVAGQLPPCTPASCEELHLQCGHVNNCGTPESCGDCRAPQSCFVGKCSASPPPPGRCLCGGTPPACKSCGPV